MATVEPRTADSPAQCSSGAGRRDLDLRVEGDPPRVGRPQARPDVGAAAAHTVLQRLASAGRDRVLLGSGGDELRDELPRRVRLLIPRRSARAGARRLRCEPLGEGFQMRLDAVYHVAAGQFQDSVMVLVLVLVGRPARRQRRHVTLRCAGRDRMKGCVVSCLALVEPSVSSSRYCRRLSDRRSRDDFGCGESRSQPVVSVRFWAQGEAVLRCRGRTVRGESRAGVSRARVEAGRVGASQCPGCRTRRAVR
jgi:hypothetical protein